MAMQNFERLVSRARGTGVALSRMGRETFENKFVAA
jgi:hypothetical protein